MPFFVLTHRPQEQPEGEEFQFVCGPQASLELTIIIAPLLLGAGKRLFEQPGAELELKQLGVRQSRFATFLRYALD